MTGIHRLFRQGSLWGALALVLWLAGCQGLGPVRRAAPPTWGEVLVYLDPLPPESGRLRFSLGGLWAERDDGVRFPLALALEEFDGGGSQRQRLVARDSLPPGRYRAVLVSAAKATLAGEQGASALLPSDSPVEVEMPFTVDRDAPAVLFWSFRYSESLRGGIGFSPVFRPFFPEEPTAALLGLVSAPESRVLTLFDKRSGRVVGAVATGAGARCVALDPAGRRAYVALSEDDAVDVVDLSSRRVTERIRLNLGDAPRELHLVRESGLLLVLNGGSDTVAFVDVASSIEVARLHVGRAPRALVPDRTGRRAFVLNSLSNTVSVIDVPGRAVASTFSTEAEPTAGEVNRRGDRLYVGHAGSPYLLALDPISGAVAKRILVGGRVSALKVDPGTDLVYVAKAGGDELSVYDPFSLLPSDFLRLGGSAVHLAVDGDEKQLYAVLPDLGAVRAVNLVTKRPSFEFDVGGEPGWLGVTGER